MIRRHQPGRWKKVSMASGVGNSSRNLTLAGALSVEADAVIEPVKHICPLKQELTEMERPEAEAKPGKQPGISS